MRTPRASKKAVSGRTSRGKASALSGQLSEVKRLLDRGDAGRAHQILLQMERQHPRAAGVVALRACAESELGRHTESLVTFERAVKLDPQDADTRYHYMRALLNTGAYDRAREEVERVLFADKGNPRGLWTKAAILIALERKEEAAEVVREIREIDRVKGLSNTERLSTVVTAAQLTPEFGDRAAIISEIDELIGDASIPPQTRCSALWNKARLCEKLERYDEAFRAFAEAKAVSAHHWDPDEHACRCDELIRCWGRGCSIPASSVDGSRLVFVLGMMRSGTSLTEQMLAQLERVTPGGEMNAVAEQVARVEPAPIPLPLARSRYTERAIQAMAAGAYKAFNAVAPSGIVTDKQPSNFYYAPLLARLFPGCKIIHCVRDPQDTCLSCFSQLFARPQAFTHDLGWLGRYYRDYQRVMDAWHATGDCDMIDVVYEETVSDPLAQTKRLAAFIGAEWSEKMLRFHESDRVVITASREQVRKPIYESSVKKHERYAAHLEPLREALGDELVNRSV